jgi:hypothetical protein
MEDLAFLVMALISLLLISGPIAIALTSEPLQQFTRDKTMLRIARRIVASTFGLVGVVIAIQFLYQTLPLLPKLFAITALVGNIYALRREIKFSQQG